MIENFNNIYLFLLLLLVDLTPIFMLINYGKRKAFLEDIILMNQPP